MTATRATSTSRRHAFRLGAVIVLTALGAGLGACERSGDAPATTAATSPVARTPIAEPLVGGPFPALLVTQAQFEETRRPDGSVQPVPGPAKLLIVRETPEGWRTVTLEDGDSNAFHKAMPWDGGLLTIGANAAHLKVWHFRDGRWSATSHWSPRFGGKFDRLRDVEAGDVDGDGGLELVIATHDQGVVAVVHPDEDWRVEEIDRQADTFVHEIELGDVDGDGTAEIFATPSKPNKLEEEQPGEVVMYRRAGEGWERSTVDAPGDTHAKEILAADVDGDGTAELYVVWEGAVEQGGALVRPVTIKEYHLRNGAFTSSEVATIPDRQLRAIAAGDVNGDGRVDLVAGGLASGLWLLERGDGGWTKTLIAGASSGFEHPVHLADLDGNGALEIYVAAEDQGELRRHRWTKGAFETTVLVPLDRGDITWNVTSARL